MAVERESPGVPIGLMRIDDSGRWWPVPGMTVRERRPVHATSMHAYVLHYIVHATSLRLSLSLTYATHTYQKFVRGLTRTRHGV